LMILRFKPCHSTALRDSMIIDRGIETRRKNNGLHTPISSSHRATTAIAWSWSQNSPATGFAYP
jgi:hypothetical protein